MGGCKNRLYLRIHRNICNLYWGSSTVAFINIRTPALCGVIVKNLGNLLKSSRNFHFIWYFKLKAAKGIRSAPNIAFCGNTAAVRILMSGSVCPVVVTEACDGSLYLGMFYSLLGSRVCLFLGISTWTLGSYGVVYSSQFQGNW